MIDMVFKAFHIMGNEDEIYGLLYNDDQEFFFYRKTSKFSNCRDTVTTIELVTFYYIVYSKKEGDDLNGNNKTKTTKNLYDPQSLWKSAPEQS